MSVNLANILTEYKVQKVVPLESLDDSVLNALFYDFLWKNNSVDDILELPLNLKDFTFSIMYERNYKDSTNYIFSGVLSYLNIPTIALAYVYTESDDESDTTIILDKENYIKMYHVLSLAKTEFELKDMVSEKKHNVWDEQIRVDSFTTISIDNFFIENDFKLQYKKNETFTLEIDLIPSSESGLNTERYTVEAIVLDTDEKSKYCSYKVEFDFLGHRLIKYLTHDLKDLTTYNELSLLYKLNK